MYTSTSPAATAVPDALLPFRTPPCPSADAICRWRNIAGRSFCTASYAFCTFARAISSAVMRFGPGFGPPLALDLGELHAAVSTTTAPTQAIRNRRAPISPEITRMFRSPSTLSVVRTRRVRWSVVRHAWPAWQPFLERPDPTTRVRRAQARTSSNEERPPIHSAAVLVRTWDQSHYPVADRRRRGALPFFPARSLFFCADAPTAIGMMSGTSTGSLPQPPPCFGCL